MSDYIGLAQVNMERQPLPQGGWVEDTVSVSVEWPYHIHIDRVVMMPAYLDKIEVTIGLAEVTE